MNSGDGKAPLFDIQSAKPDENTKEISEEGYNLTQGPQEERKHTDEMRIPFHMLSPP